MGKIGYLSSSGSSIDICVYLIPTYSSYCKNYQSFPISSFTFSITFSKNSIASSSFCYLPSFSLSILSCSFLYMLSNLSNTFFSSFKRFLRSSSIKSLISSICKLKCLFIFWMISLFTLASLSIEISSASISSSSSWKFLKANLQVESLLLLAEDNSIR